MSNLGAPRIAEIAGKPKARGAGQPPRKYTAWEWTQGYIALVITSPLYLLFWLLSGHTLPMWITRKLLLNHTKTTVFKPDVRIPYDPSIPEYMLRWWKIKRNAFMNCYYHIVKRSDDDRAHHDHPWWSFSIVLGGGYYEHRILAGGIHVKKWYGPGSMLFRKRGSVAHRLELETTVIPVPERPNITVTHEAHTIFLTGPVLRRWGFHDTRQWVDAYDWDEYCLKNNMTGTITMAGYADQLNPEQYRKD